MPSTLNLMVGNIGTGKSLIARKLMIDGAKVVNMDALQRMVAAGDYDRYDKSAKEVYHRTEDQAILSCLELGLDVVVDRTNIDVKTRARFIDMGKQYDANIVAWDFGGGDEESLKRRLARPHGVPRVTWEGVHEYMASSYEPPFVEEGLDEIAVPPARFRYHAFDFDGWLVENRFPDIGDFVDQNVERLKALWRDYSNIIIIWSCRDGDYSAQMRKWMIEEGIPFDFIGENPMWEPGSRKIFAHHYYDDRNFVGAVRSQGNATATARMQAARSPTN